MLPTVEELVNARREAINSWEEFQEGDWFGNTGWGNEFYRVGPSNKPRWISLDARSSREGIVSDSYKYQGWVNKDNQLGYGMPSGYYKIIFAKDYDPSQQPFEDSDI